MTQPIDNPMFGDLTPTAITETYQKKHYAREYRRHHAFVIKNKVNGLYVSRVMNAGKLTYSDMPLTKATGFKYKAVDHVINEMYSLNPNLDVEPFLVYRDPKTKKLCVK